ncbi:CPBP family intramembrane glutamic endopeptidase [Streptococcus moroccensis]|uniref:Membrane protease YdiL (CAAX protease family) n=1 Tax=Streptococcus moroccensis TaxID=1451356 RepID=A0ABT9YVA1_9STRE|nr:CPBP family intramembrane glutamic endopeptidase [Streptococcus moroccensis]MDQ0223522.1 membrane protease YdiL (CAAX protease family) [Streptococcus moroccensis]
MSYKQVSLVFCGYMGIIMSSYLLLSLLFGLSYGSSEFVAWRLPFSALATLLVIIFSWRNKKRLAYRFPVKQKLSFWGIGIVLPFLIVGFFWLKHFTFSWPFLVPILTTILVGLGEEFLFREIMLSVFLSKMPIPKAILFSSMVFGLSHLVALLGGSPLKQVLIQVLLATLMGVFYGFLYLLTQRIGLLALDHFFWDYMLVGGALRHYPLIAFVIPILLILRIIMIIVMVVFSKREVSHEAID